MYRPCTMPCGSSGLSLMAALASQRNSSASQWRRTRTRRGATQTSRAASPSRGQVRTSMAYNGCACTASGGERAGTCSVCDRPQRCDARCLVASKCNVNDGCGRAGSAAAAHQWCCCTPASGRATRRTPAPCWAPGGGRPASRGGARPALQPRQRRGRRYPAPDRGRAAGAHGAAGAGLWRRRCAEGARDRRACTCARRAAGATRPRRG